MRTDKSLSLALATVVAVGSLVALPACRGRVTYTEKTTEVVSSGTVKAGPPPHAPAHGYRHKHGDVVVVYSKTLSVYTVEGHSGYYFHTNAFYRSTKHGWQRSAGVKGPWKTIRDSDLPGGLQKSPDVSTSSKKKKK
jgi:hypothetical protein